MKIRNIVLSCLAVLILLCAVTGQLGIPSVVFGGSQSLDPSVRWAPSIESSGPPVQAGVGSVKIGIVGLRRIFRESQRSIAYREAVLAEQKMTQAKLEQLTNEVAADESGLKTLIRGSADYMRQLEEILHKRARLRTEKEIYNQHVALKEQKMTEDLYGDILLATSEVARQKSLYLVLEKSEPEFPASSPTQLELAMGTHKVLYSGGCLDITDEVMQLVDAKTNDKAAE
jgi:Skp family chaperone for outer membrane proteins